MKINAVLFILLTPFFLLFLYIWPSGDDYSYAAQANSTSFISIYLKEYQYWNGRYSSNILVLLNPIRWEFTNAYRFVTLLVSLAVLISIVLIFRQINSLKNNAITLSILLLLFYWSIIPDLSEGIYWYTSAVTYYLSLALFLPLLLLYPQIFSSSKPLFWGILIAVLQFLISGMNEIAMLLLLLFNCYFLLMKQNKIAFLLLLLQLSFCSLVYFAPGNDVRSSYFGDRHNLSHTVINGTMNSLRFSFRLFIAPISWIIPFYARKLDIRIRVAHLSTTSLFLLSLVGLWISCAAPVWSTGIIGQHRTVNFAMFFLILFWGALWLTDNPISLGLDRILTKVSKRLILLLLIGGLLIQNNYRGAIADLISGRASRFDYEHQQRHQQFLQAKKEKWSNKTLRLPYLESKPSSIFVYDFDPEVNHWKNSVYLQYYLLQNRNITIRPVKSTQNSDKLK